MLSAIGIGGAFSAGMWTGCEQLPPAKPVPGEGGRGGDDSVRVQCTQRAEVVQPGFGGCGLHLRMPDSTLIEPVFQSSDPKAVANPGLEKGDQVRFDYSFIQRASTCMAGRPARIECISVK